MNPSRGSLYVVERRISQAKGPLWRRDGGGCWRGLESRSTSNASACGVVGTQERAREAVHVDVSYYGMADVGGAEYSSCRCR
jgi:hypothetical protein